MCTKSPTALVLPLFLLCGLTGCVTVASTPIARTPPDASADNDEEQCATDSAGDAKPALIDSLNHAKPGLTYYLPRRMVRFSAKRTLLVPEPLAKDLKTAKQGFEAAEKLAKTEAESVKQAKALLVAMGCPTPENSPTEGCRRVLADLEVAIGKQKLADKHKLAIEMSVAKLTADLEKAKRITDEGKCPYKFEANLEALSIEADPKIAFLLDAKHSWLRDDTLDLAVNAKGLLSSAKSIAVDRTADILVEIAGAVAAFAGVPGPSSGFKILTEGVSPEAKTRCEPEPLLIAAVLDPLSPDDAANLNETLSSQLAFPYRLSVPDGAQSRPIDTSLRITRGKIFYRVGHPVVVEVQMCDEAPSTWSEQKCRAHTIKSVSVVLPQAGQIAYVPMKSSAFVRSVSDISFEDGAPTKWHVEKPSEALEFVRLPVKILTSMIQVPAQLLSLRVDYSSKVTALAENQRLLQQSQSATNQMRLCIQAAGTDQEKLKDCLPAQSEEE